jgi:hypothetical protein
LKKEGPLLQKTLSNRLNRERGEDKSLCFEIVPPHALLNISFEGLSPEVLLGQFLRTTLLIRNEGAAPACNIYIKISQPSFVFFDGESNDTKILDFFGKSSTIVKLDSATVVEPGEELRYEAWLRITKQGLQTISLLVSYMALIDNNPQYFGPGQACRTSFVSIQVIYIFDF